MSNDDSNPSSGPASPATLPSLGGLRVGVADPRRLYCEACEAELTGSCRWFALPAGSGAVVVMLLPAACPECHHLLTPAASPLIRIPGLS